MNPQESFDVLFFDVLFFDVLFFDLGPHGLLFSGFIV